MRRTRTRLAIGFVLFVFLGLSLLLARGLSGAGTERSAVLALLQDQASGNAAAVLSRLPACRRLEACATITEERVRELKQPGRVEILAYDPSVRLALVQSTGTARVAWRAGTALPVVQCVRARRESPLDGGSVELLAISAPIARDGPCP